MRLKVIKYILKNCKLLQNVSVVCIRHYSRPVLGEKVIPLSDNTLTGRLMLYLNNNAVKLDGDYEQTDTVTLIQNLKENVNISLQNASINQIMDLLQKAADRNYITNRWDFQKVIQAVDLECCLRMNELDCPTVLQLLNAFMQVVPHRITEHKFYESALVELHKYIEYCTKEELLQFMFYIGLQKKSKNAKALLKKSLKLLTKDVIQSLTPEECCIICNATFKTSTKITNKVFLEQIITIMNNNLCLLKDPALLITLLKTIRHNRYQNDDLISTISCTIFFNKTFNCYSFTAMCHILALYADYTYYDEHLLKLFVDKCVEELQNSKFKSLRTYLTNQPRAKDITRFLWAVSSLGYQDIDSTVFRDVIIPKIKERIKAGEYKNDPESLVESALYLWMLNYQAFELLPQVLSENYISSIRNNESRSKTRLNLLLTLIHFENKTLFEELKVRPVGNPKFNLELQLQRRPLLDRVYQTLKLLSPKMDVDTFKLSYQIPYLNIVGITGYKNKIYKAVNVEVLDDYVTVKNRESHANGQMQTKLRILQEQDVTLVMINQSEVGSMTDEELQDFLHEEFQLIY